MKALSVAALLLAFAAVLACADETNSFPTKITIDGVVYEDVRWGTVTPATVSIFHKTGIAAIPFEKLPPEVQKQFGYDPKKAAACRAAQQRAEAARQEALRRRRAEETADRQRQVKLGADKQKQAAEAAANEAAEDATAKKAAEARAKKAEEDFWANLGPVMMLKFTYAYDIKTRSDGTYSANLWYSDDLGDVQNMFVTFPAAGLNYIRTARSGIVRNAYVVYGRAYPADLVNGYGMLSGDTAYWLVGYRPVLRNNNTYPAW
jgi:hypothetical protein